MNRGEIIEFLGGERDEELFTRSRSVKLATVGESVYLRGLIELSNVCAKNCLYCGIRLDNTSLDRYELTEREVMDSVRYAIGENYGSVVVQAGERTSERFVSFVESLLREITRVGEGRLGITISLGEQSAKTYARWKDAGAHRYLLRMESFTESLYEKIHPSDHSWSERLECLSVLKNLGYQLGTGVMIGLPFQTLENLADDLLALVALDVDMCGMGPYVEHSMAPLSAISSEYTPRDRALLTLRMVALLRIMMPDINIAATTALDAIDPVARARCLSVGANVIMPNISPFVVRGSYNLYQNKPTDTFDLSPYDIAYGEQGNSVHFKKRQKNPNQPF